MEYIVYKRFKGRGIEGDFNLPFGTVLTVREGYLFAPDGRQVCAATSENAWNHFRLNTPEGAHRQALLEPLKKFYQSPSGPLPYSEEMFITAISPRRITITGSISSARWRRAASRSFTK